VVGDLTARATPDFGFTLYYYGINLVAFWAAILCGLLGQHFGWWRASEFAGVGMFLGWIVFVLGKPRSKARASRPIPGC
jgi:POT family proton-dependent oligopeptide transporter